MSEMEYNLVLDNCMKFPGTITYKATKSAIPCIIITIIITEYSLRGPCSGCDIGWG